MAKVPTPPEPAWTTSSISARSAKVPMRFLRSRANTSSPGANFVTPSPTRNTTPLQSHPRTSGKRSLTSTFTPPLRILKSTGLTLAAWTSTSRSPGPGSGSGRSRSVSRSGPPYRSIAKAFIARDARMLLAESEGFEPPIPLRVLLISNQVPSAARPPLRSFPAPEAEERAEQLPAFRRQHPARHFHAVIEARVALHGEEGH